MLQRLAVDPQEIARRPPRETLKPLLPLLNLSSYNFSFRYVPVVGEWVSTGVGKRDDPEGDTAEMARLGW